MADLCIIPARGGSKRIPGKNIKPFLGKPIIAYSIETAIKSGLFQEVMVSTDDPEIARIAMDYGANVPFMRTERNSDDHATTIDVLLEVITSYAAKGVSFDRLCCLYATAPLASEEDIQKGYHLLKDDGRDAVFPVVPFSYPVWRGISQNADGTVNMVWPEHVTTRSQDLAPVYHDAGQWYWFNTESLQEKKTLFTGNTASITLNELGVQDIDTETDWKIAELKYELLQRTF